MPYESNLWSWLRDNSRKLEKLHICRVENSVAIGYPDVEGCLQGRGFHIELKGALRPKKPRTPIKIKISREQVLWLEERWKAGGACVVLVRIGMRNKISRYTIPGDKVRTLLGPLMECELNQLSILHPDCPADVIVEEVSRLSSQL